MFRQAKKNIQPRETGALKTPQFLLDTAPFPSNQYPHVWRSIKELSEKAGMAEPILRIDKAERVLASATKCEGEFYISYSGPMLDKVFGNESRLSFVNGHELGHIKLGHTAKKDKISNIIAAVFFPALIAANLPSFILLCANEINISNVAIALTAAATSVLTLVGIGRLATNAISRRFEIAADVFSVNLTGEKSLKEIRPLYLEEMEKDYQSKKWLERMAILGRFDALESGIIRPKNTFEKIASKVLHFFENNHPKLSREFSVVEREHAKLARE